MRLKLLISAVLTVLVLSVATGWKASVAQEEEYVLAHEEIFGRLRRAPVGFAHEAHAEKLADSGCGVCHHTPDDKTGKLAYIEGDERGCTECHGLEKEGSIPALREAFHGNCTPCHRNLIKSGDLNSGPTTCGECHKKT
jgi:hypothetical protein